MYLVSESSEWRGFRTLAIFFEIAFLKCYSGHCHGLPLQTPGLSRLMLVKALLNARHTLTADICPKRPQTYKREEQLEKTKMHDMCLATPHCFLQSCDLCSELLILTSPGGTVDPIAIEPTRWLSRDHHGQNFARLY